MPDTLGRAGSKSGPSLLELSVERSIGVVSALRGLLTGTK